MRCLPLSCRKQWTTWRRGLLWIWRQRIRWPVNWCSLEMIRKSSPPRSLTVISRKVKSTFIRSRRPSGIWQMRMHLIPALIWKAHRFEWKTSKMSCLRVSFVIRCSQNNQQLRKKRLRKIENISSMSLQNCEIAIYHHKRSQMYKICKNSGNNRESLVRLVHLWVHQIYIPQLKWVHRVLRSKVTQQIQCVNRKIMIIIMLIQMKIMAVLLQNSEQRIKV